MLLNILHGTDSFLEQNAGSMEAGNLIHLSHAPPCVRPALWSMHVAGYLTPAHFHLDLFLTGKVLPSLLEQRVLTWGSGPWLSFFHGGSSDSSVVLGLKLCLKFHVNCQLA